MAKDNYDLERRMAAAKQIDNMSIAEYQASRKQSGGPSRGAANRPGATVTKNTAATPAQRLKTMNSEIRKNERELVNLRTYLAQQRALAQRGDGAAAVRYGEASAEYDALFDEYTANIDRYNRLYNGEYRDSAVRQSYTNRRRAEQRLERSDAGVRQEYQRRQMLEELQAPKERRSPRSGDFTYTHTPNRVEQTVYGALSEYGGTMGKAAGTVISDLFADREPQEVTTRRKGASVGAHSQRRISGETAPDAGFTYIRGNNPVDTKAEKLWQKAKADVRGWADELIGSSRELNERGEARITLAKQGLGTVGQAIVDLGVLAVQISADAAIGAATGGGMLLPMGVRSFGGGMFSAEQMGYTGDKAEMYGLGIAAVEVLTEKMASVFGIAQRLAKGAVNQEMSRRVINNVVRKLSSTPGGRTALDRMLTVLFAAGSEGLEEVVADVLEPVIRKATLDKDVNVMQEIDWEAALYDGILGGILGGLGGSVELANTKPVYWQYYRQGIDESIDRYTQAVKRSGVDSEEAQQAAREVWDGGTRKMQELVPTEDGRQITRHQWLAEREVQRYAPEAGLDLDGYLRQQKAERETAAKQNVTDTNVGNNNAAKAPEGETVRLDTTQSAARREAVQREAVQRKAQRGTSVETAPYAAPEQAAEPARRAAANEGLSAELAERVPMESLQPMGTVREEAQPAELTQEEQDELQYGSGAVGDLSRYAGLARRMGAPDRGLARGGGKAGMGAARQDGAAGQGQAASGEADLSAVAPTANDKLGTYAPEQVKNWENSKSIVIYRDGIQLRQFIEDALDGKNLNKKVYFGLVTNAMAARIKAATGLDVAGYNCTLHAMEVRKIIKAHGGEETEASRGQRPITVEDFASIPYIMQQPDEIRLSDSVFENKPVVEFVKTVNGRTTIIAYVSNKHHDLNVLTMYSGKAKGNLATAAGVQAPAFTPVTTAGTVPDKSISQAEDISKEENSNGELYGRSGERDAGERGRGADGGLGASAAGGGGGPVQPGRAGDGRAAAATGAVQRVGKNEPQQAKAGKRRANGANIEKTSGQAEGIDRTDERQTMQMLTEEMITGDAELVEIRDRLEGLGFEVRFFIGAIGLPSGRAARGASQDNVVWVRVDDPKWTATQISRHEELHGEIRRDGELLTRLLTKLASNENFARLNTISNRYQEALFLEDGQQSTRLLEEMVCDLYAGMNEFSPRREEARTLHQLIKEEVQGRQAEDTQEIRGPPEGEVRFSIENTDDGRAVAVVDDDILSSIDLSTWDETKKKQAKAAAKATLLAFRDGVKVNDISYVVNRTSRREFTRSRDTERLARKNPEIFADKMRSAAIANDIITAAAPMTKDGSLTHAREDDFVDFAHGDVLIQSGKNKYKAKSVVGITEAGKYVFYDVVDMEPAVFELQKEKLPSTASGKSAASDILGSFSNKSIADGGSSVKASFSTITEDSEGNELSEGQQEYFRDSQARDEDGRLLKVYHGTPTGGFSVFDRDKLGKRGAFLSSRLGFYFSEDERYARSMSRSNKETTPEVYACYLNIKKPLRVLTTEVWTEEDVSEIEQQLSGGDYDGIIDELGNYVAFYPNQIKLTTNLNPTDDEDVRFSTLDELSQEADGEIVSHRYVMSLEGVEPADRNTSRQIESTDPRNLARYLDEIQKTMEHQLPSNELVMIGRPSAILAGYLKNTRPLYMPQKIVRKIANASGVDSGKHGLNAILEELPHQLADPMAITGNTTEHIEKGDNSIVAWTDWQTLEGYSIIVPIRIDAAGEIGLYNNVNSAFDLYNKGYMNDLLREGNILYTKNNEDISMLLAQRRQLPKGKQTNVFDARVTQEEASVKSRFSTVSLEDQLRRSERQAAYWKKQAKRTEQPTLREKDVERLTRGLLRDYGSKADAAETTGRIKELGEYILNGGEDLAWEEVQSRAGKIASDILEQAERVDDEMWNATAELRKYLRTTGIKISPELRESKLAFPDGYGRFRSRYWNRLLLTNDGMNVSKVYREAAELWPGLLPDPEGVLTESEALENLTELVDSANPRRYNPYKEAADDTDMDAVRELLTNDIIDRLLSEEVRQEPPTAADRIAAEEARRAAQPAARAEARRERLDEAIEQLSAENGETRSAVPETAADLIAISSRAKQVQRQMQKTLRQLQLNKKEQGLVNALLDGTLTPDELPGGIDRRGVEQAYRLRMTYRDAMSPVEEYNAQRKGRLEKEAQELTANSDEWKDRKSGIGYYRETARRNILGMVKDEAEADRLIDTYVEPIREHEAAKNRMVSRYNERIKALKLETKTRKGNKVSEAYAVQYVGELEFIRDWLENLPEGEMRGGVTYENAMELLAKFWEQNPELDQDRIRQAVGVFRDIYDELFAMINEARVLNGYAPIDYRKGYFPHFTSTDTDSIVKSLANGLGFGVEVAELPTDIAGLTHLFRPGTQWSGHMLARSGNETDYNALEGWDRYIPAVANIIYHTEDIQRLRMLETVLRKKYSNATVRDEIEATQRDKSLTEGQRNAFLDKLYERDVTHLNYFVPWLREYTNQLAGKRSKSDRGMEEKLGRKWYSRIQRLENRVSANMLAGNLGSAVTNFAPLFQAWAEVRTSSMLRGLYDTMASYVRHDGFRDGSSFLVNRKGYNNLYQTTVGKVKDALFTPFNIIDDLVSETIVRARYYDELRGGLTPEAAVAAADVFAGNVMADRTIGELPVIFADKNPLTKVFTMFQVEVNNSLSHLLKDIPYDVRKKGLAAVAVLILRRLIGVYIFNDLFERVFGRRIELDPLDMINDLVDDTTGYRLPNILDLLTDREKAEWETGKGEDFFGDLLDKDGDLWSWLENLPFISSILGGGRFPIAAVLPERDSWRVGLQAFADLLKNDEKQQNSDAYDLNKVYKLLRAPLAYGLPPFLGGQARKIAEGLYAASKGGSYTVTQEGEELLQYPIDGAWQRLTAAIFGKTSTRGGKKWVASGFDTLSEAETEAFIDLVAGGSDPDFIYDVIHDLTGGERTTTEKAFALAAADLEDSERLRLADVLISEGAAEKFGEMMLAGLSFRQCAEVYDKYHALQKLGEEKGPDDEYLQKKSELAAQFAAWIDEEGYDSEQKAVITEQYKFWQMVAAEAPNYEKLTAVGLSIDSALSLATDWADLTPEPGASQVSNSQKIGAVAAAGYLSEADKQAAVKSLMKNEKNAEGISQQDRYQTHITDYDIPVETYYRYLSLTYGLTGDDLDGDGKADPYTLCDKQLAVIQQLPLQPGQKTALTLFATELAESTVRKRAPWLR